MNGFNKTAIIKKMVETDEEVTTEVSVTMTQDQAVILLKLIGRMGPKQVEMVKGGHIPNGGFDVDQTMEVVYEFYNTLYDATGLKFNQIY